MYKILSKVVICVLLVSFIAGSALADGQEISVSVDPRMELLSVVQLLSGYGEKGILTKFDLSYKEEIYEYFADFKDTKVVKQFASLSNRGFSYDAPPAVMLYLSNPPELNQEREFTAYLKKRAGLIFGGWQLDKFVDNLRDFAVESNFMQFYNDHRDYYDQIIMETKKVLECENYVETLEEYYGYGQGSFNIILVPLFHPGGYGPRVRREANIYDVYTIQGPLEVHDNLPYFGSEDQFRYLAWHEFSHSYINPLTEIHLKTVNKFKDLYTPIAEQMKRQAYSNWESSVNEHIVRAVTTRLTYQKFGYRAGNDARQYELERGFVYIDELLKQLEIYESNRDKYPTFIEFYPVLLEMFAELMSKE